MDLAITPLRQRMIEEMLVSNLSPHTHTAYLQQVAWFARHFCKSPILLGREDVRAYQVYLTNEAAVAQTLPQPPAVAPEPPPPACC
jgi:hypothetical protein